MNTSEILDRLHELEMERMQIVSEQEAINYTQSLVVSTESSRADEIAHSIARRQQALDARKSAWEREIQKIERMVA